MTETVLLKSPEIHIPGYRILRPLGAGGMASVFLAVQESLDREVALKVMAPALAANAEFTQRFLQEGQITAKLSHPNVVTVFDIGSHDNVYYLATEYIAGGTLRERMSRQGLSVAEALDVAVDVARGLDFAHSKGIVHRDVKPGNVLFRLDGSAVLADFGIAKAIGAGSAGLTSAGSSIGTPDYMSPEQAQGEPDIDGRTDLYSLGVMLFEMLSGDAPYQSTDPFAVALMHVSQPIPELPAKVAWLQPLVDGLMAKSRDTRIRSGDEFIRQLEQLLVAAPEAVTVVQSRGTRSQRRTRATEARPVAHSQSKSRMPMLLVVLAVLLAAGSFAAWRWWPQSAPPVVPQPPISVQPVGPDTSGVGNTNDVELLLDKADAYLQQGIGDAGNRLTWPDDESAMGLYRRVLELEPGNLRASEGLHNIANYYSSSARKFCDRKSWPACLSLVGSGLKAVPDDSDLLALRERAQNGQRGLETDDASN